MDVLIIGAGGHGKVVLDILRAEGRFRPVAFLDADTTLSGSQVHGLPVLGQVNLLPKLRQKAQGAIVAIGDNRARAGHVEMLRQQGWEVANAVHPSAVISPTARLGVNVVIAAGAVVGPDAEIGDGVIINTSAVVDHECQIAASVHICPAAALGGRVRIGEQAFIGLGSRIIQCLTIGCQSIVGAGAVVLEDVPDYATVVGVPARVVKVGRPAGMPVETCAI